MARTEWRGRTAQLFSFESNESWSCRGKRLEVGVKQVPPGILLHPAQTTISKSPPELLYGRKMSTKLSEIAELEESEELGYQQTRDLDAEKKQIGANHVDKRHHAAKKCVQEGDLVLLEKRKENELSLHYEKEPYQVTACSVDLVQLKSTQGTEIKCNVQHVKRFVIPDGEPQKQQPAGPVAGFILERGLAAVLHFHVTW